MKIIKYIFPAFFVSTPAFSADLCSQLFNKLKNENNSQAINHTVYFNYSVFNHPNFGMGVEYKFDVDISNNGSNNQNYNDLNEDDLSGDNFDFSSSSSSNSGRLTNCNNYGNMATFSINMVHPGLKVYSEPKQPTFFINFRASSYGWNVSSVSSSNFVNLYHTHLVNSFRDYARRDNASFSDDFYTTSLKNMVENEIYPAVKTKLESEFNLKIRNFN